MLRPASLLFVSFLLIGVILAQVAYGQKVFELASPIDGSFTQRSDLSFWYASTNANLPGVAFVIKPSKTETITGEVVNEDDQPVGDAEIWFSGFYGRLPLRERVVSKKDGTFRVELPADPGLGTVQWASYAIKGPLISRHSRKDGGSLKLIVSAGRSMKLQAVAMRDGKATAERIKNYFVHLQDGRIIPSDEDGKCAVTGLLPEIQYVLATSPGHAPFVAMFDLCEDRTVEYSMPMQTGSKIEGTVRSSSDELVPFNPVNAWTSERSAFTVGHSFTDAKGHYQISGIPINVPVEISSFSHADGNVMYRESQEVALTSIDEKKVVDFRVSPNRVAQRSGMMLTALVGTDEQVGRIRGKVLLPDGKPCPNFTLRVGLTRLGQASGGWAASYGSIGITFSNPDGTFVFSGIPAGGAIRVTISSPGFGDAIVDPVTSALFDDVDDLQEYEFTLKPTVIPKIIVTDVDGESIANATVELYRANHDEAIYRRGRYVVKGQTDNSGLATLPPSAVESGRLVITAKGFGTQQFNWTHDEVQPFKLVRAKSLTFRMKLKGELDTPEDRFVFYLVDDRRMFNHVSEPLDFKSGEAVWQLAEVVPSIYTVIPDSDSDHSKYHFMIEDQDFASVRFDLAKIEQDTVEVDVIVEPK
ncbi:MAG: carboxypeptidase-like regulatory domain-containing protein [Pirellulales bacterium]